MAPDLARIYDRLYAWCEARGFAGWDPFDGLNSRVFAATPLKNSSVARLYFTQLVKRSPFNLRSILRVPQGVNAKGLALFALAELSRFRGTDSDRHGESARTLLDRLLEMGIRDRETLAFGYNFDWQSRHFSAPEGTPTIVPTAFASQAFAEGSAAFADARYATAVEEIARFAETGLNRPVESDDEICFSYTPLDEGVIYNASLLAGECLIRSSEPAHHELARKAVNYVVRRQRDDGAWPYSESQAWVDNFHTAYVLQSIERISDVVGWSHEGRAAFERGMAYWLENFFLDDGTPRCYDNETYPIDIHSAAVAISSLAELGEVETAHRVADWTVRNILDVDGFFYYRVGGVIADETPFMRWGQAWMAYALARLMELDPE